MRTLLYIGVDNSLYVFICVDLAEVEVVLDESDSAPNVSEEQQQQSISTEKNGTSQKIKKKKKKRKLDGAGDAASSEYLILL